MCLAHPAPIRIHMTIQGTFRPVPVSFVGWGDSSDTASCEQVFACPASPHSFPDLPAEPLGFSSWLDSFLGVASCARNGLSSFIASSLRPVVCNVQHAKQRSDLWPCPPPRWRRWTGNANRRTTSAKTVNILLQRIVCTLNWLALGFPVDCPDQCRAGAPASHEQALMINELERVVWHFIRAAPFEAAQLGRSESKFVGLISLVKGLPSSKHSFTEGHMHDCIRELAASMQHYGKEPGPRKAPEACARNSDFADSKCEPSVCSTPRSRGLKGTLSDTVAQTRVKSSNPEAPLHPPGLACPAEPEEREQNEASNAHSLRRPATATLPSGIGYKGVEADRVKWLHPPTFDPNPFLTDPIVKAVFNDPDVLRLPRDQWPRLPPAQVHGTREDILALAEKWDRKQALRLIPVSEIDPSEAVGAFCIPKNTDFDRLILNPTVVNSRCCKYANFTRYLAPGSLACGIHLESGEYLRMCCDDLTDMYYTFAVPHARAKRNSLNMPFQPHEISHFSAF